MSEVSLPSYPSLTLSPSVSPLSRGSSVTSTSDLSDDLGRPLELAFDQVDRHGQNTCLPIKVACFIGAGYVGGPTAAVLALQNPQIRFTVVDKDARRIEKWKSRHLPVHEPGLYDIVRKVRDGVESPLTALDTHSAASKSIQCRFRHPNLFFSTDVEESISTADVIFLSINTDTKTSGAGAGQATDLTALRSATEAIAKSAKAGAIIVEKSTLPCRTAQSIRQQLQASRPEVSFEILSNPEFLSQGTAITDLLHPDRVLIGSSDTVSSQAAANALEALYTTWIEPRKIVRTNLWSSELAKLVANAMLAQRISSINSISAVCEKVGADVDEVARAVGLDNRIGPRFLKAGIGFGGSCFKKDTLSLIYLAQSLGLPEVAAYWSQVVTMNDFQRFRFIKHIVEEMNGDLKDRRIAILGYTFKKGTNDAREAPAIDVIKQLLAMNPLEVAIFDPQCSNTKMYAEIGHFCGEQVLKHEGGQVTVHVDAKNALVDATAVIILTDCDQFRYPSSNIQNSACQHNRPATGEESIQTMESACTLSEFDSEPKCPPNCLDCIEELHDELTTHESIDWNEVATIMKHPRWVFDGRGIVDVERMEKLGFKVERIGQSSFSSSSETLT